MNGLPRGRAFHPLLRQAGFSLIEALIAVLIFSLGSLGVAGALTAVAHSTNASYVRQVAVALAYDITDRMRANVAAVDNEGAAVNSYAVASATFPASASAPSPGCDTNPCNPTQLAAFDLWQWETLVASNLPNGGGSITVAAGNNNTVAVTVTVNWNDQSAQSAAAATSGSTASSYTVVTAL